MSPTRYCAVLVVFLSNFQSTTATCNCPPQPHSSGWKNKNKLDAHVSGFEIVCIWPWYNWAIFRGLVDKYPYSLAQHCLTHRQSPRFYCNGSLDMHRTTMEAWCLYGWCCMEVWRIDLCWNVTTVHYRELRVATPSFEIVIEVKRSCFSITSSFATLHQFNGFWFISPQWRRRKFLISWSRNNTVIHVPHDIACISAGCPFQSRSLDTAD